MLEDALKGADYTPKRKVVNQVIPYSSQQAAEERHASKAILPVGEKYVRDKKAPAQNPVHMLHANISPKNLFFLLTTTRRG